MADNNNNTRVPTSSVVGILIAVGSFAFNMLDQSGRDAQQAVRDAKIELRAELANIEERALKGREDLKADLLNRAAENRQNIDDLDARLTGNIDAETQRNNLVEFRLSAALTKLGLYGANGNNNGAGTMQSPQ